MVVPSIPLRYQPTAGCLTRPAKWLVIELQDEVCSATQFINGNVRPLKHGAHANSAHELSRFFHSISLKGDVPNTDLRPLTGC
jgi:hypothetical protein